MFRSYFIENREYLSKADFDAAERMVREGMSIERVLGYMQGWAHEYRRVEYCEGTGPKDQH